MMTPADKIILEDMADRVRSRYPKARLWAFGSRARGGADWDSDFDVCIVLPVSDAAVEEYIRDIAWEIGFEKERVITTVVFSESEFERGPISESTLVENILSEGIAA
jgi:predicted nucleotidyltransferase